MGDTRRSRFIIPGTAGATSAGENGSRMTEEITSMTERDAALREVSQAIEKKIERAFWELDDIMVTLSPDAPAHVAEAWAALHKGMSPGFIARRDILRGFGSGSDA